MQMEYSSISLLPCKYMPFKGMYRWDNRNNKL